MSSVNNSVSITIEENFSKYYIRKEKENTFDHVLKDIKKVRLFETYHEMHITTDIYDTKNKDKEINIDFYLDRTHKDLNILYRMTIKQESIHLLIKRNSEHNLSGILVNNKDTLFYYNEYHITEMLNQINKLYGYERGIE